LWSHAGGPGASIMDPNAVFDIGNGTIWLNADPVEPGMPLAGERRRRNFAQRPPGERQRPALAAEAGGR